jgi:alpha-N-acetylglucosaminidase
MQPDFLGDMRILHDDRQFIRVPALSSKPRIPMKKMMYLITLLATLGGLADSVTHAQDFNGVAALTQRVAPWTKDKIAFHSLSAADHDRFELETQGNQLHIYATTPSAAAMGFNYYLNHFCHQMMSHGADNLKPLEKLPAVQPKCIIESDFKYRYALNYCTFNYSMSFYQWKDWERELDWMALHGVNLMLAIDGMEIVWQKTLEKFGFSEKEILDFIPGPAFTAWWLLGNLEGWGGSVTPDMITRQMQLQKRVLARMKELGIEPVLHGFYGMVPNSLHEKFPGAKIIEQGSWAGGFHRPAFLSPQDSLFGRMADVYYQSIKNIYGDCHFFAADPFHEGGQSDGLDVSISAKAIQSEMQKHSPGSIWVLMAWGQNPGNELLKDLQKENVLVLELNGENENNWAHTNRIGNIPWIWCCIINYGETPGLKGKLDIILQEPGKSFREPGGKYLKGIGIAPEGILNNPIVYELLLNNGWGSLKDPDTLINDYMKYRYGKEDNDLYSGLILLKKSVYSSERSGGTESFFAARPSKEVKSVTTWGSTKIGYDWNLPENALKDYLKAAVHFSHSETFQYDITDIARQVLSDQGQRAYDSTMKYFNQKNKSKYTLYKKKFFHLLHLQEQLMATDKNRMVGTWLNQARNFGHTDYERSLSEKNARMQISIWGPDTNPETDLHDYAHKEWSGLIKDLYRLRWKMFFEQLDNELDGKPVQKINYFATELTWALGKNSYPVKTKGNYLRVIKKIE